jgi:magnesium transporter
MPCKGYYLNPEGGLQCDISEEEVEAHFESGQGLLWVDIGDTTEEDGRFLERIFNFHPLAIEDCVSTHVHAPKVEDFGTYLFIIVHGINYATESDIVETTELAIFLGHNFVVSNHNVPLYSVDFVIRQVEADGRPMRRGADFLAHAIIDTLVDNVSPAIEHMNEIAGDIEEEVIRNPQQPVLEHILKLKHSTQSLHRVMAPQREILNRLARRDFTIVSDEAWIFFRDIYDHINRIEDLNQTMRERMDNALSIYLSSVANRQNEVMKVLSIVAAIFLPLTLLVGIYGMNFENMPELKSSWGYFAVLGVIGAAILSIMLFFWSKGWINWGRRRFIRVRPFAVPKEKLVGYLSRLTRGQHH